jgi:transposase
MPRPQHFTDKQLAALIGQGLSSKQAAERLGVSQSAVARRMRNLDIYKVPWRKSGLPPVIMSVADTRAAALDNYQRVAALLDNENISTLDSIRIVREMRQQLEFGIRMGGVLFASQETSAFVDEVTEVLEMEDPAVRDRIMARLGALRAERDSQRSDDPVESAPAAAHELA